LNNQDENSQVVSQLSKEQVVTKKEHIHAQEEGKHNAEDPSDGLQLVEQRAQEPNTEAEHRPRHVDTSCRVRTKLLDTADPHQHAILAGLSAETRAVLRRAPQKLDTCPESPKMKYKTVKVSDCAVLDFLSTQLLGKTIEERREARSIAETQLEALKLEREVLLMREKLKSQADNVSPKKPVRPVGGAWQVFSHSVRGLDSLKGMPLAKRNREVREMWKQEPEHVKASFQTQFEDRLTKYHADKAACKSVDATNKSCSQVVPPKPKRPVGGAKKVFASCIKHDLSLKGLSATQRIPRIRELWEEQLDHEKAKYEQIFQDRRAQYHKEKAAYTDAIKELPAAERQKLKQARCPTKASRKLKKPRTSASTKQASPSRQESEMSISDGGMA
jgi:hypothetical protein